jgi:hypothetical protein
MAGYSKRSLADKLGIKPGHTVLIFNAPEGYAQTLGPLPEGVSLRSSLRGVLDVIHFFTASRAEFESKFLSLKSHLAKDGMLWVSWPKGGAKAAIKTDMNENIVRDFALAHGLVDVKVAAIDETWSGLKLVYRLKDR